MSQILHHLLSMSAWILHLPVSSSPVLTDRFTVNLSNVQESPGNTVLPAFGEYTDNSRFSALIYKRTLPHLEIPPKSPLNICIIISSPSTSLMSSIPLQSIPRIASQIRYSEFQSTGHHTLKSRSCHIIAVRMRMIEPPGRERKECSHHMQRQSTHLQRLPTNDHETKLRTKQFLCMSKIIWAQESALSTFMWALNHRPQPHANFRHLQVNFQLPCQHRPINLRNLCDAI